MQKSFSPHIDVGQRGFLVIGVIAFFLVIVLTGALIAVLNTSLWHHLQVKYGVGSSYAPAINQEVRSFFFSIQPHDFEAFNDAEDRHMADVRKVVHGGIILLIISILVTAGVLLFLFFSVNPRKKMFQTIFFWTGIICIFLPFILMIIPFSSLFTAFHQMLFPHGNWMFPPDSALLYYYPLGFFVDMAKFIVAMCIIAGFIGIECSRHITRILFSSEIPSGD